MTGTNVTRGYGLLENYLNRRRCAVANRLIPSSQMKIAIINVPNKTKFSMNKDLAGGIGQTWDLGNSLFSRILAKVRKNSVNLPVLSLAYIQAILKGKGVYTKYFESIPHEKFDIFLIYGSMIDYQNENQFAKNLKRKYPDSKIGFIGPFPSKYPRLFKSDFIIIGEPESFFLYAFNKNKEINKRIIKAKNPLDLNDLPTPDFDNFPIATYSYFPALTKQPVLTLQASRGCPYSCIFYCPYGSYQGSSYKKRAPEKLIDDIKTLIQKYKIKSLQFRDPTFGIDKEQVKNLCKLLIKNKIKINWGIETRPDLLSKQLISLMFKAGLRNINLGIETPNPKIAKINKRKLSPLSSQKIIIDFCKRIGVKISAFYIFGYEGDTIESINRNIEFSIKLNTNAVRFAISTPFPGTEFFEKLKKEKRITTFDFNKYNSFNLVFKHNNLKKEELSYLMEKAYRKYYLRPGYMVDFLKWKIREFWL